MGIKNLLFKWFKFENKDGKEINLGYVLDGEPKTEEELQKVFKTFDLENKFSLFKPLIRSKIDIELTPVNEDDIVIEQSKIGGKPDLINESSWPKTNSNKSLSFIAQFNCEEISAYDKESLLPKRGLISFFYCSDQEAWGFDPNDLDRFKVIYTENLKGLRRIEIPKDLEKHLIFNPNRLKFDSRLSIPGWEHDSI